jgi:hypothetical protein
MASKNFFEHPTEEALEQFVMNRLDEADLEYVETHIMACEPCVSRLEALEVQVPAMQGALQQMETQRQRKEAAAAERKATWRRLFTVPNLSWAAAAAVLALAVTVSPHYVPTNVQVSADRDNETVVVPDNRPLHVALNAVDVPDGRIKVELVDNRNTQIWSGTTEVEHGRITVSLPRLSSHNVYFVRIYELGAPASDPMREFRLQAS